MIVKHNNPCGVAVGADAGQAYAKAFACDPVSAFGGIIAVNRRVDARSGARRSSEQFVEVLIAPGYDDEALEILTRKQNVRILQDDERRGPRRREPDLRQLDGGMLVQDGDADLDERDAMEVVAQARAHRGRVEDLLFAWRVSKHVKLQRDRPRPRPGHHRDRRRPDEPGRLRPPLGGEGAVDR